jgi:hypothetical protein
MGCFFVRIPMESKRKANLLRSNVKSRAKIERWALFLGSSWTPKQGRRPVAIKTRHARRIRGKKYYEVILDHFSTELGQRLHAFNAISDPDLDSGWIQGVCADILSHTWPVRGGDQSRTTPMPFQRIPTGLCGSPDHPRRAETAERATWGTKPPPRPPTAGTPPAPARVRRKPWRWDPLVPIWGGSPVAAPRPPAP